MPALYDLRNHPVLAIVLCALWAWISVTLVLRLWLVHRQAKVVKKLFWSCVLAIPLFGWLFYAGLFRIPEYTDIPCPETPGIGGAGGSH